MTEIKPIKTYEVAIDPFSVLADRNPILWEIKHPHTIKIDVAQIKAQVAKLSPEERAVVLKNAKAQADYAQAVIETMSGMK